MSSARSPLRAVLEVFSSGARSVDEIADRAALRPDLVRAIIDHLVRTGHLRAETLSIGCPPQGCGGCPVSSGCAITKATSGSRDGALVTLSLSKG